MQSLRRWFTVISLTFLAGCRGMNLANQPPAPLTSIRPVSRNVVLVVLENQRYTAIIGNQHAPFMNQLAAEYSVASNFYADLQPSIGNYFMLTVGLDVTNDLDFATTVDDNNLARVMGQAGMSWKAYLESIPRVGYRGGGPYPYVKVHNPFAYFNDIEVYKSEADNMVGLDQFTSDVANDALPAFSLLIPDQTHNMHDCPGGGRLCTNDDKVQGGDLWLQQQLAPLLASPGYKNHETLLIVTWDDSWEHDTVHGGGHIPVVLAGPLVKQNYVSTTFYQHESVLRLICEYLGLPNTLGKAANAPSMNEFLTQPVN